VASAGVEDGGGVDGCPAPAQGCCGERRGDVDEAGAVAGWGRAAVEDGGVRPGRSGVGHGGGRVGTITGGTPPVLEHCFSTPLL
jgi:hypothetical protein